ncbi:MAG: sensor histidine kinase, partial [Acidobacteria bacterium]|nr:sensor histidine kinase [Acidobacteriota bacterium]
SESIAPLVPLVVRDAGRTLRARAASAFDPYIQARQGGHNSGLSMTLVHHCVALSGGTVEVKSEANCGTAFVLTFPAAAARA